MRANESSVRSHPGGGKEKGEGGFHRVSTQVKLDTFALLYII